MIEIRILRNTVVDVRTEAAAGEVLDVPADVAHALLCARAGELVRAADADTVRAAVGAENARLAREAEPRRMGRFQ